MASVSTSLKGNFFQRLSPLARVLIAVVFAVAAYFIIPCKKGLYFDMVMMWDLFAGSYLLLCWIVLFTMPVNLIKHNASKEDGSKFFVFLMIIISSIAGMVAVFLLIIDDVNVVRKGLLLFVAISGMALSWALVHTIFTFHYAHLFYGGSYEGGLEFPGNEKEPGYLDFAYFSFVVGCTFQVSDIGISSKKIRRLALVHGLLAFVLNTFVVALSINIVASLLPNKKHNATSIISPTPPSACHSHSCSQALSFHSSAQPHDYLFHTGRSL